MSDHDHARIAPTHGSHRSLAFTALPVDIPADHIGPVVLPGSGRLVWWTGRVAIGLRHEPQRCREVTSQSAMWVQDLMLSKPAALRAV